MCLKVETGAFVIAVINALIWAFSVLGIVIGLIVANILVPPPNNFVDKLVNEAKYNDIMYMNLGLAVGLVLCVINLIFAVLLCNGISNRKVGQIKAYFIYGLVNVVIALFADVIGIAMFSAAAIFLIPIGIYCVFLHIVNMTMKKFGAGDTIAHRPLVEVGINYPINAHSMR